MDRRFELRCTDEMLVRWRAAVPVGVPFASWVRGVLDAAAAGPALSASESELRVLADAMGPGAVIPVRRERGEFRPDFGKRLKP